MGLTLLLAVAWIQLATAEPATWVGTWASAVQSETAAEGAPAFAGATVRQVVHVTLGGERLRVRLSNTFGHEPLVCHGARIALAEPGGAIRAGSDRELRFSGQAAFTIPAGATIQSDPVDLKVAARADLAISLHVERAPAVLTVHPGSRTTSFVQSGDALSAPTMPTATKYVHWYFISGVDVVAPHGAAAVVLLGDSITDGRGTTTDGNDRWPDEFVRRFQARPHAPALGVLNLAIGANRLLRDGVGPSMLSRLDRDVFAQTGVRWVLVFGGINDIGTRLAARKEGKEFASVADIIAGLDQMVVRVRSHGLKIYGATITPYEGAGFYWSPDGEADRQTVNQWIRTSGRFDAVVDFDAALRDPAKPTHLAASYDSGDHLHPSLAGYVRLAESLDPQLFAP